MAADHPRYGHNNPLHLQGAFWDGHRSVRFLPDNEGMATVAYSYLLSHEEMHETAERLALLWNLHRGQTTEELRAALALKP